MRSLIPEAKVTKLYRRPYIIDGDWIKPEPFSEPESYNPFEFYKSPINKVKNSRITSSPHLEFANLDFADAKQIAAFCSKWGQLGAVSRDFFIAKSLEVDSQGNRSNVAVNWRTRDITPMNEFLVLNGFESWEAYISSTEHNSGHESLQIFQYNCQYFQALVGMKNVLFPYSEEKILELKDTWNYPQSFFPNLDLTSDNAEELATQLTIELALSLKRELSRSFGLVPFFEPIYNGNVVKELNFSTVWTCDSFLTAMFLMLHMDLTAGTFTVKCAKCKHWFETTNKRAEYCKESHQVAAKSARRYDNKKAVINEKRRIKGVNKNG